MSIDTSTPRLGVPIDRDTVAAMRIAESVSFHHGPEHGSEIRLYLDSHHAIDGRIYTAREQRLFPRTDSGHDRMCLIPASSAVSGYGPGPGMSGWNVDTSPEARAFAMIHSAGFSDEWRTIAALVKPGDRLGLVWLADNNTDVIRDAGLHHDELRLTVERNGVKRALSFLVESSASRDNTARMIRRHGA